MFRRVAQGHRRTPGDSLKRARPGPRGVREPGRVITSADQSEPTFSGPLRPAHAGIFARCSIAAFSALSRGIFCICMK